MPSEKIELPPLRKKLEISIAAYKTGMVSMGYILDALDEYEAEVALLAVKQERGQAEQDAKFWRWWVGDPLRLEWAPGGEGQVRWVRWIDMPQPDISKQGMEEKGGGLEQLCDFLAAAIRQGP